MWRINFSVIDRVVKYVFYSYSLDKYQFSIYVTSCTKEIQSEFLIQSLEFAWQGARLITSINAKTQLEMSSSLDAPFSSSRVAIFYSVAHRTNKKDIYS